jgi:hypothetical protein
MEPTPAIIFYSMTISAAYGYCILVVCISWLIQTWLGINVVRARQAYDVQVRFDEIKLHF